MADLEPVHRDDVDNELVAEIEKTFAELYPGYKVVFAGDEPGGASPRTEALLAALQDKANRSLAEGTCIDCGAKMPDYRPTDDDWDAPDGWGYFSNGDDFGGWQCPKCDREEQDGLPRPLKL